MKTLIYGFIFSLCFCIIANSSDVISDIENHWNQINTMSGKFKQKDPDGITSYGNFISLNLTNQNLFIMMEEKILSPTKTCS